MWTSIWYTSLLAILMADIRTGAIQNNEVEPQRCYYCPNNTTTCYQQKVSILCTAEEPYCGTVAVGPGYISRLKCLPSSKNPCLIYFTSISTLELSCVCFGSNCNAPFTKRLQNQLLKFANTNPSHNSSDVMNDFLQYLNIENTTDYYTLFTNYFTNETEEIEAGNSTATYSTLSSIIELSDIPLISHNHSSHIDAPHAEPLKHEATVPPDDDEDESEGSGVYDDPKSPKNPASAPAAPSSYLPAEENKASSRFQTSLALFILIMYATL